MQFQASSSICTYFLEYHGIKHDSAIVRQKKTKTTTTKNKRREKVIEKHELNERHAAADTQTALSAVI